MAFLSLLRGDLRPTRNLNEAQKSSANGLPQNGHQLLKSGSLVQVLKRFKMFVQEEALASKLRSYYARPLELCSKWA
jgi:hypothetical protein